MGVLPAVGNAPREGSPRRIILVMVNRVVALVTLIAVCAALSGCSSDFDDAMARGCNGLRAAASAYAAGDRPQVEAAKDDAGYLGMASELTDTIEDEEQEQDALAADLGYKALFSAAYEPAESNGGALIWQGKKLDPQRRQQVAEGLAACEDYGE